MATYWLYYFYTWYCILCAKLILVAVGDAEASAHDGLVEYSRKIQSTFDWAILRNGEQKCGKMNKNKCLNRKKDEKPSKIEKKKLKCQWTFKECRCEKVVIWMTWGKIKYFNGEFFLHRNILHNARFIRFSHLTCLPTNFNIPPRARDSYIKNKNKTKTANSKRHFTRNIHWNKSHQMKNTLTPSRSHTPAEKVTQPKPRKPLWTLNIHLRIHRLFTRAL